MSFEFVIAAADSIPLPRDSSGEISTEYVGGSAVTETPAADVPAETGAGGWFGGLGVSGFLIYGAMIAALYFFLFRPQRKREKELRELQSSLKAGDNVLTSSGMYGVIASVGEDCFVIEFGTNKGVRIPVRKGDIIGVKAPGITPAKAVADNDKQ